MKNAVNKVRRGEEMFNFNKNKQLKADYQMLKEIYAEVRIKEIQGEIEIERLKIIEKENELINRQLKDHHIIGVATNNENEKQYVRLYYDSDCIDISLRNVNPRHLKPRLHAKIRQDFQGNHKKCELIDIFAEGEDSGNGTILLKYLFMHLKKQGVSEVTGWLSDVDEKHFDKLEHFYKKNGFHVSFNENRTCGSIALTL